MKARKKTGDDKRIDRAAAAAKRREEETALFSQLCEIARKRNGNAFKSLFHDHYTRTMQALSFDFVPRHERGLQDKATVMRVMAEEGNDKAVDWLAKEFEISLAQAVEGYARVGKVDDVDKILYHHTFNVEAVRGFAFNGNVEQVDRVMKVRGVDAKVAAYGYGRGGHLDALKALFDANNKNMELARAGIEGLVLSKHFNCIGGFIEHAAPNANAEDLKQYFAPVSVLSKKDDFSMLCAAARDHLSAQGYLSEKDKFLELMACTESELVKGYYVNSLTSSDRVRNKAENDLGASVAKLAKEADLIRAEMKGHECGFADARGHLAARLDAEAAQKAAEEEAARQVSAEEMLADLKEPEVKKETEVDNDAQLKQKEEQSDVKQVENEARLAEEAQKVEAEATAVKDEVNGKDVEAEAPKQAVKEKAKWTDHFRRKEKAEGSGCFGMFRRHKGEEEVEKQVAEQAANNNNTPTIEL